MTPEGRVKLKVKAVLNAYGAYHFWAVQTGFGARTLDCLGCHNGQFFAIETKAPGKSMTEQQEAIAERIEYASGPVFVISDIVDLEALEDWLRTNLQVCLFQ